MVRIYEGTLFSNRIAFMKVPFFQIEYEGKSSAFWKMFVTAFMK